MVFVNHMALDADTFTFGAFSAYCCTSSTFLSVARNDVVKFTKPEKLSSASLVVCVFEFSDLPSKDTFVKSSESYTDYIFKLDIKTRYILLQVDDYQSSFDDGDMSIITSSFSITK